MEKRAPRLKFSDEERADPALKKPIRKVQKAAVKADKAQAQIPKKTVKTNERVTDSAAGKSRTRLKFEEIDKKKPSFKLTHTVKNAPGNAVLSHFHREIRQSESDNVGVEAAHKSEETAELSVRAGRNVYHSHKLKPFRELTKAESRLDRANVSYLQKKAARNNPQLYSNPLSRWKQKRAIKKQYANAKRAGQTAGFTSKTAENAAKAAKRAARESKRAVAFFLRHHRGILIIGGIFVVLVLFLNSISSFSVLLEGGLSGITISTYPSTDEAMLGAEAAYATMEADLQNEVDNYETLRSGYDEYNYDLDEIWHDPYVLISLLTAWHGGEWTLDEVQDTLSMLFDKQYQLTQTVAVEVRYRAETNIWTDSDGIEHTDTYEVPYNYYICSVTLNNENLSHLPVFIMSEDKVGMYAMYMSTLGNRPDLFEGYPNASTLKEYTDYDIPEEYLSDEIFAAIITEAEKYLGYPYVWGGSNPTTSFDCSGFVSWVLTNSGVLNTGRLGAQGLYNICTPVSAADVKPSDLVFFEHTYDTEGVSHVGIYVGDGMMIAAGDPISYTSIETSYWQSHLYGFGRLPVN